MKSTLIHAEKYYAEGEVEKAMILLQPILGAGEDDSGLFPVGWAVLISLKNPGSLEPPLTNEEFGKQFFNEIRSLFGVKK